MNYFYLESIIYNRSSLHWTNGFLSDAHLFDNSLIGVLIVSTNEWTNKKKDYISQKWYRLYWYLNYDAYLGIQVFNALSFLYVFSKSGNFNGSIRLFITWQDPTRPSIEERDEGNTNTRNVELWWRRNNR